MKYIVDAQLPKSLAVFLTKKGHDCIHTLDLPSKNSTEDTVIIHVALSQNRVVITKDTDFLDSFLVKGKPEKLVLVKTGNIKNAELATLFNNHMSKIENILRTNNLI